MRLNLGTLTLGAALLVNAGEAQAGQKGRTPLAALQEQELAKVQVVIMDSILSEQYTPQHEANAQSRGYGTYHNPASGAFYVYSKETFQPVDSMASLGVIFKSTQESSPDALCFSAITFVDEFTRDGQRFLVLDDASITNSQVACPEDNKEVAVLEYKPQSGKFADLEPERIKEGLFWAPMLVVKAGEDVPDELTTTNYITSTQAGGSQTVYKKYTLKNYSPETGVLELIDPVDGKKCMQTRVFKDRIIGTPTRYILSEPGTPEMQEALCEEDVSVSAAPSVPASSVQDPRSKPALRATLLAGLEIDEVVDQPSFGPSAEVAGMFTIRPFNKSQFSVGAMADIIISPQGSGIEGAHIVGGSQGDLLGIYGLAGVSSEPRWSREDDPTTPEIERDPYDGVFAAGALVMVDLPFKGPLGATCGVSAELIWGGGDFPLNVGVLCGGTFDFDLNMADKEKNEKPLPIQAPSLPDAVVPPVMPRLETSKKPYSVELKVLNAPKEGSEEQAGITQKFDDMRKAAQRNGWDAVEEYYDSLIQTYSKKKKLSLSSDIHLLGAEAARALGNVEETYERLQYALQRAEAEGNTSNIKKTSDWLKDFTNVYGRVEITSPDGTVLSAPFPFPPDARKALDVAIAGVADDGDFVGFIPLFDGYDEVARGAPIEYTLNGVKLVGVVPLADSMETTEIKLEK